MTTKDTRPWVVEFGTGYQVPAELDALVNVGLLADASWHNDTCPHFTHEYPHGFELSIWVEHIDPKKREDDRYSRFVVAIEREAESYADLLCTEDVAAVVTLVRHFDFDKWLAEFTATAPRSVKKNLPGGAA